MTMEKVVGLVLRIDKIKYPVITFQQCQNQVRYYWTYNHTVQMWQERMWANHRLPLQTAMNTFFIDKLMWCTLTVLLVKSV